MVVLLTSVLIFAALAVLAWAAAVVAFRAVGVGPDPAAHPDHRPVLATAVVLVVFAGFLPFWPGHLAEWLVWAATARRLGLPPARAALLGAVVAAAAVAGRFAVGDAMAAAGW